MKKNYEISKEVEEALDELLGTNSKEILIEKDFNHDFEPDSYDANGQLTINSWELYKSDELAKEEGKKDE